MKKDLFGNKEPVEIGEGEYWFNGRIIQNQPDPRLPDWASFADDDSESVEVHGSMLDAVAFCLENPCENPHHQPEDYL